jgi:glucoamylase
MQTADNDKRAQPGDMLMAAPRQQAAVPPTEFRCPAADAWLYAAILGNGRMLVCLDELGGIAQVFYPRVDIGPHVRTWLEGLQITEAEHSDTRAATAQQPAHSGTTAGTQQDTDQTASPDTVAATRRSGSTVTWLGEPEWRHTLSYESDGGVLRDLAVNGTVGVRIERVLHVRPDTDVLAIELAITNDSSAPRSFEYLVYAGLDINHRRSGNMAFFDAESALLTFGASHTYFVLASDAGATAFTCDKVTPGARDEVFSEADAGALGGREYAIGQVSAAVRYRCGTIAPGETQRHRLRLCAAESLQAATTLASRDVPQSAHDTARWWHDALASTSLPTGDPPIDALRKRSLMVLKMLTDSETGGVIAAPECDPDFRSCGGYGMCWPRDGAFVAHALDIAGRPQDARAFFEWALRTQEPGGVWYQRYYVSGALAPTWGLVQFDETGAVVWALCRHIALTDDQEYARRVWPQALHACEYMQAALDPATGLAPITKDLWEERDEISTYACASTYGAFAELAALARRLGEEAEALRWSAAAAALKQAIETHLWDERAGHFRRGLRLRVSRRETQRATQPPEPGTGGVLEMQIAGQRRLVQEYDPTLDTSILGLSVPFGVFEPSDPRMRSSARAVKEALTSPVGGILRYEGDTYRGGNPWIICTLWLAWQQALDGAELEALDLYRWALDHRTSLDLLPEQVDQQTGTPCWVVPLAWSHAMFLLLTQVLAERGALP